MTYMACPKRAVLRHCKPVTIHIRPRSRSESGVRCLSESGQLTRAFMSDDGGYIPGSRSVQISTTRARLIFSSFHFSAGWIGDISLVIAARIQNAANLPELCGRRGVEGMYATERPFVMFENQATSWRRIARGKGRRQQLAGWYTVGCT